MEWLTTVIIKAIEDKFTGYIQINFFKGGIASVDRHDRLTPPNNWKTELAVRLVKSE